MREAIEENKKVILAFSLVVAAGAVFAATQTNIVESVTGTSHSGDAMESGDAMQAEGDAMESDEAMNSNDSMDSEGDAMDSNDSMDSENSMDSEEQ